MNKNDILLLITYLGLVTTVLMFPAKLDIFRSILMLVGITHIIGYFSNYPFTPKTDKCEGENGD